MTAATAKTTDREGAAREIGQAVKHTFVYGLGGMLQKAAAFLLLPFYTHYLRPSEFGVLEILNLTMTLIGMFLAMGIPAAVLRYYGSAQSEEEKRRIVSTAYACVAIMGVIVLALGSVVVGPVSRILLGPTQPGGYLLLMFAYFVLGYINGVPSAYLRAREASMALMIIETSITVAVLGLTIYLVAARQQGVFGVLLSQLIVLVVFSPALAIWMFRQVGFSFDPALIRKLLSFGAPLIFSSLAMFTLNFSDRLFLQRFRSLDEVGIYSVGYKFGYMINFLIIQPFNLMWMSRMYQIHGRADCKKIFSQIFALYSLLLISAALAFAVFSPEILRIMVDARYLRGGLIVAPVVLSYVFLGIGSYVQLGAFLTSRTGLIGIVSAIAALLNLCLNYVLIRQFGMVGAAWATASGFLILAVGSYYVSQRVYPVQFGLLRVLKGLAVAIVVYAASLTFRNLGMLPALALKMFLLLMFVITLRGLNVIHKDDLQTISLLAKRVRASVSGMAGSLMEWRSRQAA